MRIDVRKVWKCIAWTGPNGEVGHGLWALADELAQDDKWCLQMDARYPGWRHTILQRRGSPGIIPPEGWVLHPYYGDMQFAPMEL